MTTSGVIKYNSAALDDRITELRGDPAVHSRKGVYEYALAEQAPATIYSDPRLLDIRIFDDATKNGAGRDAPCENSCARPLFSTALMPVRFSFGSDSTRGGPYVQRRRTSGMSAVIAAHCMPACAIAPHTRATLAHAIAAGSAVEDSSTAGWRTRT